MKTVVFVNETFYSKLKMHQYFWRSNKNPTDIFRGTDGNRKHANFYGCQQLVSKWSNFNKLTPQ